MKHRTQITSLAALGLVLGPVVPAAGRAFGVTKTLVDPFFQAGKERLVGGVLNRFDGVQAGYSFLPKWKVNAVVGKPTEDLLDKKAPVAMNFGALATGTPSRGWPGTIGKVRRSSSARRRRPAGSTVTLDRRENHLSPPMRRR